MQPDDFQPVAAEPRPLGCTRICAAIGLILYMPLASLLAFSHCSRIDAAPHFHPITAILLGPFALMPFHGVTFGMFALAVALGMGPLFVVVLSRKPRWRLIAAVVTIATWIVSVALVTGPFQK